MKNNSRKKVSVALMQVAFTAAMTAMSTSLAAQELPKSKAAVLPLENMPEEVENRGRNTKPANTAQVMAGPVLPKEPGPVDKEIRKLEPAEPVEVVIVSCVLQPLQMSLQQKRNAAFNIEVITAEDVGKFPDNYGRSLWERSDKNWVHLSSANQ